MAGRPRGFERHVLAGVLTVHGLIHFMGLSKGLGWASVEELREPISHWVGAGWGLAAVMVLAAGVAVARPTSPGRRRHWWLVPACAAAASQALVVSAWSDARAGTVANVLLAGVAVHAYRHDGARSLSVRWAAGVDAALASLVHDPRVVLEEDLSTLPAPVAAYVRRSGALGRPRVQMLHAQVHGRIRGGPDQPWMRFYGRQVNTFGPLPQRFFLIEARMRGVPATVLHAFGPSGATMRGQVASLVPFMDASGAPMNRAETVTVLNDIVLMAPAALLDVPVQWQVLDDHRVQVRYTRANQTVAATLVFDESGDLVDFVSDDRARASRDGRTFTPTRWSTPIRAWTVQDGHRFVGRGEGRWHSPPPDGDFSYVEFYVDSLRLDDFTPAADTPTPAEPKSST